MSQINGLNELIRSAAASAPSTAPAGETAGGGDFAKTLMDSIGEVNRLQAEAADATQRLAAGSTTNVAEVMLAVQRADVAYSMLMEIKNKLMDAYAEIQQMRI